MTVDGVEVVAIGFNDFTEAEAQNYIDYCRVNLVMSGRETDTLTKIQIESCPDGKVDLHYVLRGEKFERIRRITGYLVGTTDRWNNAKRAEEHERVKHF